MAVWAMLSLLLWTRGARAACNQCQYTIKSGDTYSGIASSLTCYSQWPTIKANNGGNGVINVGNCLNTNLVPQCNKIGPADTLSGWSDVGGCVSCSQYQTRTCGGGCYGTCGGASLSQYVGCGSANTLSGWSNIGGCNSCLQQQTRKCSGGCNGNCGGASLSQAVNCGSANTLSGWSDVGSCNACSQQQTRTCGGGCFGDCGGVSLSQAVSCGSANTLSGWSDVGGCNSCSQEQTRTCRGGCYGDCGGASLSQSVDCGSAKYLTDCVNSGDCDATCGYGQQLQTRSCAGCLGSCPTGDLQQYVSCSAGAQKAWTSWIDQGVCSTTCGMGQQYQTRTCEGCLGNCSGDIKRYVSCGAGAPVFWTNWIDSGVCSTDCGIGTLPQTRSCAGCVGTCPGSATQSIWCSRGVSKSWTPWANSTNCSATCIIGSLTQVRNCSGCIGSCAGLGTQSAECFEVRPHAWTAWTNADNLGCPVNCQRPQVRVCNGCSGPTCFGARTTNAVCTDAYWTTWSSASNGVCNNTCGSEFFKRNCSGCAKTCLSSASSKYVQCGVVPSPNWGTWAAWGCCTVNRTHIRHQSCHDGPCPLSSCRLNMLSPQTQNETCVFDPRCLIAASSPSMSAKQTYGLAIGVTVAFVIGVAVLLVWRRKRSKISLRFLAIEPLGQLTVNPLFLPSERETSWFAPVSTGLFYYDGKPLPTSEDGAVFYHMDNNPKVWVIPLLTNDTGQFDQPEFILYTENSNDLQVGTCPRDTNGTMYNDIDGQQYEQAGSAAFYAVPIKKEPVYSIVKKVANPDFYDCRC